MPITPPGFWDDKEKQLFIMKLRQFVKERTYEEKKFLKIVKFPPYDFEDFLKINGVGKEFDGKRI